MADLCCSFSSCTLLICSFDMVFLLKFLLAFYACKELLLVNFTAGSNHASLIPAMLSALSIPESHESYKSELLKASENLEKAKNGMEIGSLIESLKQKNDVDMCAREAKPKEVFIKERCQAEKGLNQLQKEAEKGR